MRLFSRIVLSLLAVIGVSALGYYAYILSTETLTFPFIGMEDQRGSELQIIAARPSFLADASVSLLDMDAIRGSLYFGNQSLMETPSLSGEYTLTLSGEYVGVRMKSMNSDSLLRLSADDYNKKKTTKYRFGRDITLRTLENPRWLDIVSQWEPRERRYSIRMFGFDEIYTPEHVRFYSYATNDAILCRVDTIPWHDAVLLSRETTQPYTKNGQILTEEVRLQYDSNVPRICIIAGVNGEYRVVEDRILDPFVATGSVGDMISPEIEMMTQVEFTFSEPLYSDTGALYSPEYIARRHDAKIEFLKHLQVDGYADPVTPDNITFSPQRAIITLPLQEGKKYVFRISDIADIYGRTISLNTPVTPKRLPFLSLKSREGKTIFPEKQPIDIRLYSLDSPRSTYALKLCRMNLDSYSRLERIVTNAENIGQADIFSLMNGSGAISCNTKDVVLSPRGYMTSFSARDIAPNGNLTTGLYALSFANPADLATFTGKLIPPLLFSVIDTHITMKVDASGKMVFLATDIETGLPLEWQEITVMRNVTRTHIEKWNSTTQTTDTEYVPLSAQSFATGLTLGKTNAQGFLEIELQSLKWLEEYDTSPFSLTFENWWMYEGRYDSFLVQSRSSDRLGYLVSTWNDGITWYNFWLKDSDYSYSIKSRYTSYLHTDRRLYLPGETVHIHGIMRENSTKLEIPTSAFDLVIADPMGREIKRVSLKPNEFGTISADIVLPGDASLGSYTLSLQASDVTEYVENGWANFQVEVFKNPTFTAEVKLQSPDIDADSIIHLREKENTDANNPWYEKVYEGRFLLEGIIKARYYNGAQMKNTPFTYRIYRSEYYDASYWNDCFWGCGYQPMNEFYSEGTGSIDSEGYGFFRAPIDFTSFYNDYSYTVEIIIRDPLTGEEVVTPASLIVKLPAQYKTFNPNNPITFVPKKKILQSWELLQGELDPLYGTWDSSLSGKYAYEIMRREYIDIPVDDIRAGKTKITHAKDSIVATGSLDTAQFSKKLIGYTPGEYHFRVMPMGISGTMPESSITDSIFYIAGAEASLRDSSLRVIPEKTVYNHGDTARVLVQVPFTGSHILLTKEKGGILEKEYFYLSGNTFTRDIKMDDTLMPNAYIGVVALRSQSGSESSRSYAVGYGELVTSMGDKKSRLNLVTDKPTYKNRETVRLDMTLTDKSGNPLQGEVAVMVVDESLIRLLWNIDLDILPKFYQKYPFTMKTSLTAIGIERNRFLSRKGSNGGSGDKWGDGVEIASRSLFQNTAYYNPSIRTDIMGKARIDFLLPDNITDYRIIAISNTKNSLFSTAEKTIAVRKDYTLESQAPMIVRNGDTFTITASAFNATKKITNAEISLLFGTGGGITRQKQSVILNPSEAKSVDFSQKLPGWLPEKVPYTLELRENGILLDSLTRTFRIPELPIMENTSRIFQLMTGASMTLTLPQADASVDGENSKVEVIVASSYVAQMEDTIRSLLQYPYGCIEQTISSTLPNAIALSLADRLGIQIDRSQAEENTKKWLSKILRMQHYTGGWTYWEGDATPNTHITPFVLRSLISFRKVGQVVPQEAIDAGVSYIITNEEAYKTDANIEAEVAWTLAILKHEQALSFWNMIDPKKLDRHGYLAYANASHLLGKLTPQIQKELHTHMNTRLDQSYWYWDSTTDSALYAQFLLDIGDRQSASYILDTLSRSFDPSSYYISTQAKIQFFLALSQELSARVLKNQNLTIALRGDALIADASIRAPKMYARVLSNRAKIGATISLKRDAAQDPLYVIVNIKDRPKSVVDMPAVHTGGIRISRTFDRIDESKWIDARGDFLSATPVTNGIFEKGKLYRVTLTTTLSGRTNTDWYNLASEDFLPAGWRPIRGIFKTESIMTASNTNRAWWDYWDYVEARDDRILSHISYGYGDTRTYIYYVRPESIGQYLLPPATAYFMYQPEIHAYTKYEKISIIPAK